MRHLILTEGHPPQSVALTAAEANALDELELALVTRSPHSTGWDVAAGNKVGVMALGELQVTILPKVPIDRLVFMMGYARNPAFWRNHDVRLDLDDDLATALAHAFVRQATQALEQGLLHGYRTRDDTLPVLRGRVRVGEQIGRRFGVLVPLEVTYDEFTADIAENQILHAAVVQMLRAPSVPATIRRSLHRLRLQLTDVSLLDRGLPLPTWQPSRLNIRYQPALRLAELILAGNSFEQRRGDLTVSGFVLDMWRIYEDFVCVALAEAIKTCGGTTSLQYRSHLDRAETVPLKPDLVWSRGGSPQMVVDAKYKAEKPAGFPQADLYQLLAYCTVFQLDDGHLVYAKGEEVAASHHVIGSHVRIHCHTLDLTGSPRDLLGQIERLAAGMIEIASSG
ncbi:McrC family protein [Oryzihumus leptocrescens]|uniref:5-methylcytosine-specific restriction enzyme subunit McrC n=1 Tax=Oryzihumus leptocrescens TaxID=297536 RepID=A0A542ZKU9_9MICO|nr:restriction endonuclease [Oryzihumus leptocrescens]TQL60966.1 5-methylcytosine-specific restriction enzyme subunit McrC [Oryzihumus leptocrescens]